MVEALRWPPEGPAENHSSQCGIFNTSNKTGRYVRKDIGRQVTLSAGDADVDRLLLAQPEGDGHGLRQEGVEQVQYYDPDDRATIRVTVPLVRDVMVQMETY